MSTFDTSGRQRAKHNLTRQSRRPPSWRRLLLLWLPAAVVVVVVFVPIAYLVMRAAEGGQENLKLLLRAQTLSILGNTALLASAVTIASVVLATTLAWLTARSDLPWRRGWAVLTALPLVIPSYVGAYLFAAAFGPRGMLQAALEPLLGVTRLPSLYGFPGAFFVLTLLSYPYILLPVRAALQRMDPALEESAQSLGLQPLRVFFKVVLPQLRPSLTAGGLLVALYVIRDFGAVSILRFTTFTRAIHVQYQSAFDRSGAALYSLVLVLITFVLLALELRTRRSAASYRVEGGSRPRLPSVSLDRWTSPALVLCAGTVLISLIVPSGVLGYWLLRALDQGPAWASTLTAAGNSVSISLVAAATTLVASLPIGILGVRAPGRLSRWLESLSHIGFALPGIVIALALVFFGIRAAPPLYGTFPLLLLAYLILFLPQSVGSVRATIAQVPVGLEEAGRSLGRSPLAVFFKVTAPLLRPGILASAALVFLTCMKELQATLILSPIGFKSLSTQIWSSVSEAFFAQAAGPSLVLILAASVPMAFFMTLQDRLP
jgi:iron(III) transport system permease protein